MAARRGDVQETRVGREVAEPVVERVEREHAAGSERGAQPVVHPAFLPGLASEDEKQDGSTAEADRLPQLRPVLEAKPRGVRPRIAVDDVVCDLAGLAKHSGPRLGGDEHERHEGAEDHERNHEPSP